MARTFPGEVLTMGPNEEPVANYMTRAAYGNPREKGWYGKSVVTVYAPNGVPFAVHREAAPAFDGFLKELSATGYTIRPADSGGYNLRTKRGGTSLSQHAFGNAIDINWSTNPMQRQLKTDMPENIKDMAAKWGLEWGGTWRGQKDAMHFEWTGVPVMPGMGALRSKEDIMAAQRMLAAQGLYNGEIDGETGPLTRAAIANYAQASGTMVAGDNALPLPDYSGDPFGVAASKQPQDAQSAIASLIAPSGGPSVPDMPTAAMGYAPNLSGTQPPAPPMPQVASNPAPLPTPPPQWVDGGFAQDTMAGGTSPPMPRLRDQSVLDQQRADMLDEMLFGAGPHRGEFARGRPEGRWTGGGAPDASAVPMPSLSPLNPAVGGPADRRPTPPMPTLRPEGRWMPGTGGAPDAGSVPNPPPRGTPYAPAFPDVFGEQPTPYSPMVADRPEFPGALPAASRSGDMSAAMGNAPPPPPPGPYDDWTREFDTPGPITMANERMGVFEGTPDPSTIAPPSRTPEVGNVNYSGPLPTQRLPQTQAAVSEPGMGLGPYGMTPPPPETGPFFDNANPGPTFTPPAPAGTSFNIPPSPFQGSTGEFFTPAPPMPQPQPSMMADRFSDAFSPGGGGQIMDLQTAFDRRNAPPTMNAQDGINSVFGAPPAQAMPPNLAIPFAEVPRPNFDFAGPAPAAAANITSPLPMPTISPQDFDARFAGGTVTPATPTPGVTPGVVSGTMPTPEGAMDIRPPAQQAGQTTAPAPLPEPAPAPTQAARQPQRGAGGFIGRALGGLLGGPLGAIGGGLLGGGGGFGFGGSASFNPIMGSGGTAPSTGSNGQTFNTTYRHGNAGNMQGTMWNRSGGGSVGYVTDPFTGAMIYSTSPMTF